MLLQQCFGNVSTPCRQTICSWKHPQPTPPISVFDHQSLLRTSSKLHDPHPASHRSLSRMRTCSLDDLASIIAPSQSLKKLFRPYHTSLSTYFTHRPDLLFRMDQSWRQTTNYKRHSGAKQPSLGRPSKHTSHHANLAPQSQYKSCFHTRLSHFWQSLVSEVYSWHLPSLTTSLPKFVWLLYWQEMFQPDYFAMHAVSSIKI